MVFWRTGILTPKNRPGKKKHIFFYCVWCFRCVPSRGQGIFHCTSVVFGRRGLNAFTTGNPFLGQNSLKLVCIGRVLLTHTITIEVLRYTDIWRKLFSEWRGFLHPRIARKKKRTFLSCVWCFRRVPSRGQEIFHYTSVVFGRRGLNAFTTGNPFLGQNSLKLVCIGRVLLTHTITIEVLRYTDIWRKHIFWMTGILNPRIVGNFAIFFFAHISFSSCTPAGSRVTHHPRGAPNLIIFYSNQMSLFLGSRGLLKALRICVELSRKKKQGRARLYRRERHSSPVSHVRTCLSKGMCMRKPFLYIQPYVSHILRLVRGSQGEYRNISPPAPTNESMRYYPTDSTKAPSRPQNQSFSWKNVPWLRSTRGRNAMKTRPLHLFSDLQRTIGSPGGTVSQQIRPGAGFKTGDFVKEKLGELT